MKLAIAFAFLTLSSMGCGGKQQANEIAELRGLLSVVEGRLDTAQQRIAELEKANRELSKGIRTKAIVVEDAKGRSVFWAGTIGEYGEKAGVLISSPANDRHITIGLSPHATIFEAKGSNPISQVEFRPLDRGPI